MNFGVASNGQSSSVLDFGCHADLYPDISYLERRETLTRTGDSFNCLSGEQSIGLMNLDVQGAEQEVLIGFENTLKRVEAIYCEVNLIEIYRGNALFPDLNRWLRVRGFQLCDWEFSRAGWGDALWIRSTLVPRLPRIRRVVRAILFEPPHQARRLRSFLKASPVGRWIRQRVRSRA